MDTKKYKIKSLQGLRAIAFLSIFSEHAGITHLGSWGVSCFIILSGFLMQYNYVNVKAETPIRECILFAINKIKKLYPLHIITFIISLFLYWNNQRLDSIRHFSIFLIKMITNLFLLQSWVPKAEFYWSFNAVSWYLSTAMFMYFAFPYITRKINEIKLIREGMIKIVLIMAYQTLISILMLLFESKIQNIPLTISDDLTKYITYICPLYRLGDFYIGCLLGNICFKCKFNSHNKLGISILEIALLAMIPILQVLYNNNLLIVGRNAFKYTLLYTLNTMLIIFAVSCNEGIIAKKIFSSKLMVFIGDMSGYAFLIHQLVIVFFQGKTYSTVISLSVTMLLSYGYYRLEQNRL